MRCRNCDHEINDKALMCPNCEAAVELEMTREEEEAARTILSQLPPEALEDLQRAFAESPTREDFVNAIMVGPCPKCGSTQTGDCENDPEINEVLLARCYACGQYWCAECESLMAEGERSCLCWTEDLD